MKHKMSSHGDIADSAMGKLGDNEAREYKKKDEYEHRMDKDAVVQVEGCAAYHDYRTGPAPMAHEARNDHVTPPAPAVGASRVYQGEGTN